MNFSRLNQVIPLLALTFLAGPALAFLAGPTLAQEGQQYANIKPGLKCHHPRKERSFCKAFPNFSLRRGICNPEPEMLGHIEWCRENITVTERLECGEFVTYEAVVVTYRPVYENGAWGKRFTRTYRKEAFQMSVPALVSK